MTLGLGNLVPADQIRGEDDEETVELQEMLSRAVRISCPRIGVKQYPTNNLGFGVGGVVAVFLLRAKLRTGGEELLWVVEGDLPSAYLVTDRASNAATALNIYADLMQDWVKAVRRGGGLRDCFLSMRPLMRNTLRCSRSGLELLRRDIIPAATRAT